MQLTFTTVDVFTKTRYQGNPLAIVLIPLSLRTTITEEHKLKITSEFNLSETVFLHDVQPGEDFADYDIFTPGSRMAFAGHPTIGTAIYVAKHAQKYAGVRKIRTVAGTIPFFYDEGNGIAQVGIPHDMRVHESRLPHPFSSRKETMNTTGEDSEDTDTVPAVSIVKGMAFNLIPVSDTETLGRAKEGLVYNADISTGEYLDRGSGWDKGYHGSFYYCDLGIDPDDADGKRRLLRTRMFGSREDAGTGSASCTLAAYLASLEPKEKGRGPFAYHLVQGVEMGRRCDIFVEVERNERGTVKEVKMSGCAVQVMEGVLDVDQE